MQEMQVNFIPPCSNTFIVDRVDPQLEETVLDPACGTGGFLTNVIDYKRNNYVKSPQMKKLLQKTISVLRKNHCRTCFVPPT